MRSHVGDRIFVPAFVASALGAAGAQAQGRLEPGEWEMTSSTEVPGLNAGPLERTERQCYTTADQKIYATRMHGRPT